MAQPEKVIRDNLKRYLTRRHWLVEVTHGNRFQVGIPDLWLAHVEHGHRWVDTKVKGRYSLTKAQRIKWPKWEEHGVGIWILTGATDGDYAKLFELPNWRDYWKPSYGRLPDVDAELARLSYEYSRENARC